MGFLKFSPVYTIGLKIVLHENVNMNIVDEFWNRKDYNVNMCKFPSRLLSSLIFEKSTLQKIVTIHF